MRTPVETFHVMKGVLSDEDRAFLKRACRAHISAQDSIPSYVLIDQLNAPVFQKIKRLIEEQTGQDLLYLNDFYLYSDSNFGANWHMDTELFTFHECLNAWILLSPDEIESPLSIAVDVNDSVDNYFHSIKPDGEDCVFVNYRNRKQKRLSLQSMEASKIDAPAVEAGDILILNPKKFHKTNTTIPKHAYIIKFIVKGEKGTIFSDLPVPPMFWPETGLFSKLVKGAASWDEVIAGLQEQLTTAEGRKILGAGFFPEKIDLYRKAVQDL